MGEKELSQAKCAAGLVYALDEKKSVCGLGYYIGESPSDTFNYTRCHLESDDTDGVSGQAEIGNMNDTCANGLAIMQ